MLFPHPSASKAAPGFLLFTRFLPRSFIELANITATLVSFYWLGFETPGLSPDKKRLAWLAAQREAHPPLPAAASVAHGVWVVVTGKNGNKTAGSG